VHRIVLRIGRLAGAPVRRRLVGRGRNSDMLLMGFLFGSTSGRGGRSSGKHLLLALLFLAFICYCIAHAWLFWVLFGAWVLYKFIKWQDAKV